MSSPQNNHQTTLPFNGEAVFASLIEAGHAESHIKTFYKSGFKKGFSQDIDSLSIAPEDHFTLFELVLNRDGIYDCLPEGLFHQTKGSGKVNSVTEAVEEHKQFKEEEKQARSFFAPLEQVLFQYKAAAESAERDALYNIQNRSLTPAFYAFWNISTDLPQAGANRLLQLMPYSAVIKGDIVSTATALAHVLGKKVQLETGFLMDCGFRTAAPSDQRLGVDTVIGDNSGEQLVIWHCRIYGIQQDELAEYVPGASMKSLLDRFVELFVPLDVDFLSDLIPSADSLKQTHENILGVGAYL